MTWRDDSSHMRALLGLHPKSAGLADNAAALLLFAEALIDMTRQHSAMAHPEAWDHLNEEIESRWSEAKMKANRTGSPDTEQTQQNSTGKSRRP